MHPQRRRSSNKFALAVAGIQHRVHQELTRPAPAPVPAGSFPVGHRLDTGGPLYLAPDFLIGELGSHAMIQAPTGRGKTSLVRPILRSLFQWPQPLAIWIDDPKGGSGDLYQGVVEDCAALGLDNRAILFNTGDGHLPTFNPFRRNGLAVADQALWILGAIKACWGQETFEQTPQMLRWLFNAVSLAVEGDATFRDALEILQYEHSDIRRRFVERTADPLLKQEWSLYQALPPARRREETASAYARLRPFCTNPTVEKIVGKSAGSLDLGEHFLKAGRILATAFPRYRPLAPELTTMLRSLCTQSILAQALHIPLGERPPLVIVLEEAEHALEHDTGAIETILAEGRSLGIHLVLVFHTFAQVQKKNPALLASVLSHCQTKIIGGGIPDADLDILTPELYLQEWHPYIVRDEITGLEVEPVEELRAQVNLSEGEQHSLTETAGLALASALAKAIACQGSWTKAKTDSQSRNWSDSDAHADGFQEHDSSVASSGEVIGPDGVPLSTYGGDASVHGSGYSCQDSAAHTEGGGRSRALMRAVTTGIAGSLTRTLNHTSTTSIANTVGRNNQQGVTIGPFLSPRKRWKVVSRQFISSQDFLTMKRNILKTLARGSWAIKRGERRAICFRAAWPITPLIASAHRMRERLAEFSQHVCEKPFYCVFLPEASAPYQIPAAEVESPQAPPPMEFAE